MPTNRHDFDFSEEMKSHVEVNAKSLDSAISWMQQNLEPEDIFSEKQLSNWAESNGYRYQLGD